MSTKQQPAAPMNKDTSRQLFELLIALDHHQIDLKHAMEKAWESEDYTQVREHLFATQDTLSDACQLLLQDKSEDSLNQ